MNKKTLFALITFISFSGSLLAQSSGSEEFSLTFKFKKNIPIENIDIYYNYNNGNKLKDVNYKINSKENQLILFGENHFIYGVSFPTIVFSYNEKIYDSYTNKEVEFRHSFYFITDNFEHYKYYKGRLNFTKNEPNIVVTLDRKKDSIYKTKKIYHLNWEMLKSSFSNNRIKVKKLQ